MALQGKFPKSLLSESTDARREYFLNHWAAHTQIKSVAEEVLALIRNPIDSLLIYLVGPTGVGKSTVLKYVLKVLYEEALAELEKNPGKIPAAYILAQHPQTGTYDWTLHFTRIMTALNDVLIDRKIYLPSPTQAANEIEAAIKRSRGAPRALRQAAAKAMQNRICKLFMIDDAHFIGTRCSGVNIIGQANTIKSFADESGRSFLLGGTFDLLPLRNLNGQLGRRSVTIYFKNYKYIVPEDKASFISVLKNFLMHLPLAETPDFTEHWEFCYERCVGCIGILKDWLYLSLKEALTNKKATMPLALFKKHAPPLSVCLQIAREIKEGEAKLYENEEELSSTLLRSRLGMPEQVRNNGADEATKAGKETPDVSTQPVKLASSRAGKGIQPKPQRYPIGDNTSDM